MKNGLTIDVEDYFHASVFSGTVSREDWRHLPPRVEHTTFKILQMLATSDTKATFFILGWVAEQWPDLVREIARDGHEIALHGYAHRLVSEQTPEEFRDDVARAKGIVEDITGHQVTGYRAPTWSISKKTSWALEILKTLGFKYDCSVFPLGTKNFDFDNIPQEPHQIIPGLMELPMPVLKLTFFKIPFGGGVFFRLYPYCVSKLLMRKYNKKMPFISYFHPWEFDSQLPRIEQISQVNRFRTYFNLCRCETRFKRLINDFSFCTLQEIYQDYRLKML